MKAILPFVMLSLVVSSCTNNQPTQPIPDIDAMEESGNLGKCTVSIGVVYSWRDWQPNVQRPGQDGGSPLYIKVAVHADNSTGTALRLSWDAYVFDVATREFHPIELVDKTGTPRWDGRVGDSEVREAELMTHDGPYLAVGNQVIIVFRLRDQGRQVLWLQSKKSRIGRSE